MMGVPNKIKGEGEMGVNISRGVRVSDLLN